MCAARSLSVWLSLVVMPAVMSGCAPDEPTVVVVAPEPVAPEPDLTPDPQGSPTFAGPSQGVITIQGSQAELNGIRERTSVGGAVAVDRAAAQGQAELSDVLPQTLHSLVFECPDGVTFAVRTNDRQLVLYPPGYPPNAYLTLAQVQSDPGVMHYKIADIEFRSKDDLATLQIGRQRYVDCVANPAAAVWQEVAPRISAPR